MEIEKAFDSLDHKLQRSATRYFSLQRGATQGDPISAYVFILCLEILFTLIKNNTDIKGVKIFEYCYFYAAYADDSTFFLKDENFIVNLSKKFKLFSDFSGLKPNTTTCKTAGVGLLKRV